MTQSSFFKKVTDWLGSFSPAQIWLFTLFTGDKIGTDRFGNVYYEGRPRQGYKLSRRWVIYKSGFDASAVPPEWHGWLHHQTDQVPASDNPLRRIWQKAYEPNATGTQNAYFPPGYPVPGLNHTPPATGDYKAWQPPG